VRRLQEKKSKQRRAMNLIEFALKGLIKEKRFSGFELFKKEA
jgi:hypothetical protein